MTHIVGHNNASSGDSSVSKTVLVIEDNELNMMLFSDLLDSRGYSVLQARKGMDGWRLAQEHHPSLVVMDIQLPDVSDQVVEGR